MVVRPCEEAVAIFVVGESRMDHAGQVSSASMSGQLGAKLRAFAVGGQGHGIDGG